jgi:hypothetical protein
MKLAIAFVSVLASANAMLTEESKKFLKFIPASIAQFEEEVRTGRKLLRGMC